MVFWCFRFLVLFLIFHIFLIYRIKATEFGKWDIYSHHVVDVLGREVDLEKFRGKVSLQFFIFCLIYHEIVILKTICCLFSMKLP